MKSVISSLSSLACGVCLLALSAGAAFAGNLHNPSVTGGPGTSGQTGTQPPTGSKPTIASCGGSGVLGNVNGLSQKTNGGINSPFGPSGEDKKYAGAGAGNSGSNPNSSANSQYDNACAQAQLH